MQIHKYIIKSLDFVKKFNLIFWVLQIPFYFHCNRWCAQFNFCSVLWSVSNFMYFAQHFTCANTLCTFNFWSVPTDSYLQQLMNVRTELEQQWNVVTYTWYIHTYTYTIHRHTYTHLVNVDFQRVDLSSPFSNINKSSTSGKLFRGKSIPAVHVFALHLRKSNFEAVVVSNLIPT